MQIFQHSFRLTVSFLLVPGFIATSAIARQTTVTGTADMNYDFRDRTYVQRSADPSGEEGDTQQFGIGPGVSVVSRGINDTLSFNYAPLLNYDFVTEASGVDHRLNLSGERHLSPYWSFTIADDLIRSDDPSVSSTSSTNTSAPGASGQPPTPPGNNELSRDLSGQKYWTNTATARTTYALAENSRIGGGYSYSLLRSDGGNTTITDYDRHVFSSDYSHGFNQNWRSILELNYTRGLYDNVNGAAGGGTSTGSPDLHEYGATLGVDYVDSVRDFFPLRYTYLGTEYDGETRSDIEAHQWSAGWDHAFDVRTRVALGGGPSYAKTQGLDGTWGYNANLTFTKRYEHASYTLQFNKQLETRNFTGSTTDSGLTDTYSTLASFNYQYTQSLALDMLGRYSWFSTLDPQGNNNVALTTGDNASDRNVYEVGAGVNYSFAQWYRAGIRYVYYVSDGNLADDQYTDHQVLLTLTAAKELWRW